MTNLGKVFVFTILGFSVLGCTYGLVVYFDSPNWGWKPDKTPQVAGQPVDSELAKKNKSITEQIEIKKLAAPAWSAAWTNLAQAEAQVAGNQYWFYTTLARLLSAEDHDIQNLKKDSKNLAALDASGRPILDKVISKKTSLGHLKELNGLQQEIENARKSITTMLQKEQEYTEKLNGKEDPATRTKEKGLYDLVNLELEARTQASQELDEVKPKLFQELIDSQIHQERRKQLLQRIRELESVGIAKR